ncbi:MAG: hypothetical protein NT030_07790 [Candidatus Saganbacteria bacterium]|nr:hypothetical protein [Candidatus Saganbacteria bacterium]
MNDLIKKIKQKGFWQVTIRPSKFIENRISSISDCENLIKSCVVSLRGWDYPHIDKLGIKVSGNDSIESYSDWPEYGHIEYWRFYQSGQFVHYFAMKEDYSINEAKLEELKHEYGTNSTHFLEILSALFTVTEIFEFAQRLVSKEVMGDSVEILIELGNVEGRQLFFWNYFSRCLSQPYICAFRNENITVKRMVSKEELLSSSNKLALNSFIEILYKFNWKNVSSKIFEEDQKKLLERRL